MYSTIEMGNILISRTDFVKRFDRYVYNSVPFLFLIDFNVKNFFIIPLSFLENQNSILYDFNGLSNITDTAKKNSHIKLKLKAYPISFKDYKKSFNVVFNHFLYGDSYLLNLTFPTKVETDATMFDIFYNANAPFKIKFFEEFVFFSPERFILIKEGKVYTYPMKGTKIFENKNSEIELLNNEKEMAEHLTVVDLLRNDLSMIAKNVRVNRFRYTSYIKTANKTIIQTSSEIEGELLPGSIAEKIIKILPAGSISGAPKRKTLEIISEAEMDNRGFYTGIAGIFDGKIIDTCVIIRFIENNNNGLIYRSGGGITVYSKAEKEYQEMIDKIYVPCF